jgi:hypothetical protein
MHASEVLQRCLRSALVPMHGRRRSVLLQAVDALVGGRRLTLTDLARSWPGAERVAAPLKKIDRLLSNGHLSGECSSLYAALMQWCVRQPRPVIVVDWSDLDGKGRFHLLRAALAVGGRTLTLWERVAPLAEIGSPRHERDLLYALHAGIPAGCRPILITDAGFRAPWFKAVQELGWDFVGRLRHRMLAKPVGTPDEREQWVACRQLYALITRAPRDLGLFDVVRNRPVPCRLIVHRKPPRGRVHLNRAGQRAGLHNSRKHATREAEPWLLAASFGLADLTASQIVALYARRMQIEQSFRDLKSHRYGVGFEDSLTRIRGRLAILLMLHALACLAIWIAVKSAEPSAIAAAFDATVRVRYRARVSWHRIGWMLLRHGRWRFHPGSAQTLIQRAGDAVVIA